MTGADNLVSIVITTRNRPTMLLRALRSALAQTVPADVIVVDDGSEPPVYLPEFDHQISTVRLDVQSGVCAARNAGLKAADGDWVWFLDDDDELEPEAVRWSLRAARESSLPPPVAVLSGMALIGPLGETLELRYPVTLPAGREYFLEEVPHGSFQVHNTLMAPLAALREIGGWNEGLKSWEHDDLFLRLNSFCSLQGTTEVTYKQHQHAGDRSSLAMHDRAKAMEATLEIHAEAFLNCPRTRSKYLGTVAVTYLRAGYWLRALPAAVSSFRIDPRRPRALRQLLIVLAGPWAWRTAQRVRRALG